MGGGRLLPEEAVDGPVLEPQFAGTVGVLFEEDAYAAVFEQRQGGVDRGTVEKEHRILPGLPFVVADEDADVAAFHGVGYAVEQYVAAVALVGSGQAQDVAVAGVGGHAVPTALGTP